MSIRHILALQLFALSAYALYCLALLLLDRDIGWMIDYEYTSLNDHKQDGSDNRLYVKIIFDL